jgi:hypothetical protein
MGDVWPKLRTRAALLGCEGRICDYDAAMKWACREGLGGGGMLSRNGLPVLRLRRLLVASVIDLLSRATGGLNRNEANARRIPATQGWYTSRSPAVYAKIASATPNYSDGRRPTGCSLSTVAQNAVVIASACFVANRAMRSRLRT